MDRLWRYNSRSHYKKALPYPRAASFIKRPGRLFSRYGSTYPYANSHAHGFASRHGIASRFNGMLFEIGRDKENIIYKSG